jgi:hypothetical protein
MWLMGISNYLWPKEEKSLGKVGKDKNEDDLIAFRKSIKVNHVLILYGT